MLRRALVLLFGTLALTGCATLPGPATGPGAGGAGQAVAILLPLTGARADVAKPMLQAAELALVPPGSPRLIAKDTGGTPEGAAAAAQAALAEGAKLILGPLTSGETAAVAPIARQANVAVLAFTNDPAQAQPGVWTLGITPAQQVRRLVAAATAQGKTDFAGLLPDTGFGHALGDALLQTTGAASLPGPHIRYYSRGMTGVNAATKDIAGYASRRGSIDAKIRDARGDGTPEGRQQADELAKSPVPPPPFNALLLGDTGETLSEIASLLPYYDVDRNQVKILGPALWSSASSGAAQFSGAWYAAADPAARVAFEQAYTAKYGTPASPLSDLAFDAASIARVLHGNYSVAALTQPAGFAGADGWLALLPDGEVRRGLALFRVDRDGGQLVEPAPASAGVAGT